MIVFFRSFVHLLPPYLFTIIGPVWQCLFDFPILKSILIKLKFKLYLVAMFVSLSHCQLRRGYYTGFMWRNFSTNCGHSKIRAERSIVITSHRAYFRLKFKRFRCFRFYCWGFRISFFVFRPPCSIDRRKLTRKCFSLFILHSSCRMQTLNLVSVQCRKQSGHATEVILPFPTWSYLSVGLC